MKKFMVWAVTGAGKTEMMFPIIQFAFNQSIEIAIVTPRRDVVIELYPRLCQAFPNEKTIALYGGSEDAWHRGHLTIATTHQMIRFASAFSLIIIDEFDAFPFHNNPMLNYVVDKALKSHGKTILLTATPPKHMVIQAERGELPHVMIPRRHHGYPLPYPQRKSMPRIAAQIKQGKLSSCLINAIKKSLKRGAQLFLFVPEIKLTEPTMQLLNNALKQNHSQHLAIEATSSQDPKRQEKVRGFREGSINIIITTTILERGVTVPLVDVFILDADSHHFDSTSLVQMAGRAGRSKMDPEGKVYFYARNWTQEQQNALKQIKKMNKIII